MNSQSLLASFLYMTKPAPRAAAIALHCRRLVYHVVRLLDLVRTKLADKSHPALDPCPARSCYSHHWLLLIDLRGCSQVRIVIPVNLASGCAVGHKLVRRLSLAGSPARDECFLARLPLNEDVNRGKKNIIVCKNLLLRLDRQTNKPPAAKLPSPSRCVFAR